MSYIAPNTDIILLHNCPLENSYEHTIYFASATAQYNYFYSLRKYVFSSQSYQRYTKGSLRIMQLADNLYDCNYLMFKNTSFGNKWFYAFITGVEYVSNTVSEVFYEIDVMQTWAFNYTLGQCMVEREHSATDNVGDNILPENLEIGDYVLKAENIPAGGTWEICLAFAGKFEDGEYVANTARLISNVCSGLNYLIAPNTPEGINSLLTVLNNITVAQKSDAIVALFSIPSWVYDEDNIAIPATHTITITKPNSTHSFQGYFPKNKKLYTYPYTFLRITNFSGQHADLHWEYFSTNSAQIDVTGVLSTAPSLTAVPLYYKGSGGDSSMGGGYLEEMVVQNNFPFCEFNTDAYKAWLAQNRNQITTNRLNAMGEFVFGAMNLGYGNIFGASQAMSGFEKTANLNAQISDKKGMAANAHGNENFGFLGAMEIGTFGFQTMMIKSQYAKIVDDYFTMYGYACHQLKVPNTHVRPHWTYTKTVECAVTGSIPANDLNTIKNVFNNGITFWTSGSEIGNYSLDNSPT